MGCFPVDFQEVKRPLRTKSVKRPIKVGKRPINEGKRPVKAKVLVGVSVGCLMGCFRATPPWRKTAPLKRPIKRSMVFLGKAQIVSRTLSGLFLVGALNRLRKRKRTNRENPRTIPEQIGKIPEKSGKSQKGQKRTKKSRSGNPPRLKPPRLAALDY